MGASIADTDVDDDSPRLHHAGCDEPGSTRRHHENVRLAGHRAQIGGSRVADGDRGAPLQEQQCHRFADDVAAADYDGVPPLHLDFLVLDQFHHSEGRAGHEARIADCEQAHVGRMKSVYVLRRGQGFDHPLH